MKLEELKNKTILIVGAGREGKATFSYLTHNLPGQVIAMVDQQDGPDYLSQLKKYEVVIKSPGIKPGVLTVPYTTAANIFFANVKGLTIGVTGTKGKSTTASLIHAILRQAGMRTHLVGNIGNPMLAELLENDNKKEDVWVCELSSYMTGDLHYSPHISVMVNLFPEHMDYHGNIGNYYQAKKNILAFATGKDFFVYNPAFGELEALAKKTKAQAVPLIEKLPFDRSIISLQGEHNYDLIRAAVTVATILHIPDETIEMAVKTFQPLPHRLQNIGTFHGITFYDDAISTTPQSAIAAIKTLPNINTIFLGGQNRGFDFSELAKVVLAYKISNIVLFPDSGDKILQALEKRATKLPVIYKTDNNRDAIAFAYEHTKTSTICLMSPASPSYSLWENFEERGDEFQREVVAYQKMHKT